MKHMVNHPEHNGQKYYVSTKNTTDHGLETAVFKCDDNYDVSDFSGVYVERYENEHDAARGHMRICRNIEKYVTNPDPKPEEKNPHEPEETVTITSKQLQEALAEAFSTESHKFFERDEAKGLLFSLFFGGAVCEKVITKLFGEKGDE
jgi:hypothetical protein